MRWSLFTFSGRLSRPRGSDTEAKVALAWVSAGTSVLQRSIIWKISQAFSGSSGLRVWKDVGGQMAGSPGPQKGQNHVPQIHTLSPDPM